MAELHLEVKLEQNLFNPHDHIIITGDFDKWEHKRYILRFVKSKNHFEVRIPYEGQDHLIVKFLVNGTKWMTLNCLKSMVDEQGYVNNIITCKDWLKPQISNSTQIMEDVNINISSEVDNIFLINQMGTHQLDSDYIHVTSRGELSSSEDIELSVHSLEKTLYNSLPQNDSSHRHIKGFLYMMKRIKTYWKG